MKSFMICRVLSNGHSVETQVESTKAVDALKTFWESLTDEERDNTESTEILETF